MGARKSVSESRRVWVSAGATAGCMSQGDTEAQSRPASKLLSEALQPDTPEPLDVMQTKLSGSFSSKTLEKV